MNIIVGDRLVWSMSSRRTGRKTYIVEVLKIIRHVEDPNDNDRAIIELATICNAHTGKKRRVVRHTNYGNLTSLEEFLDEKRQWIKELEKYL